MLHPAAPNFVMTSDASRHFPTTPFCRSPWWQAGPINGAGDSLTLLRQHPARLRSAESIVVMSDEVRNGNTTPLSAGWEFLNPSHPLFPVIFPKTAERAARENPSPLAAMTAALEELRSKVRWFLFAGMDVQDVVDHILGEVIVRISMEKPLGRVDPLRGTGGGLFHVFLERRIAKEVRRAQREVPTISFSGAEIPATEKEFDKTTPQNRDLLAMVMKWLPTIPGKQAAAVQKWLADENSLTKQDRVNRTRALAVLRGIATRKGLVG